MKNALFYFQEKGVLKRETKRDYRFAFEHKLFQENAA